MRSRTDGPQSAALEAVAAQYRSKGYEVSADLDDLSLDAPGRERIDLIARLGHETVFVEVKRATGTVWPGGIDEIDDQLAQIVKQMPATRFDIVVVPDPSSALPTKEDVTRNLDALSATSTGGSNVAASFVMAAAAIEGLLRVLAWRSNLRLDQDDNLDSVAATLRAEGLLGQEEWSILDLAGAVRTEIVHGLVPSRPPTTQLVDQLLVYARRLNSQVFVTVEEIVNWFHAHYEDPVHHLPHDSSEGGYQYLGSGPYDARAVVEAEFPLAPSLVIDEAVHALEDESSVWVRLADLADGSATDGDDELPSS